MKKIILTNGTSCLIILSIMLSVFTGCNQNSKEQNGSTELKEVEHVDWSKNASIYEVNIRQYTPEGTFNAFAEHLPRLKELGTDILWLMPIHPIGEKNRKGTMGSYYAVKDYYGINPEFGTEEDFRNLIAKIHALDMYVIIDWVANHSAWDNPTIYEHPEWYITDSLGNIIPPVEDWSDVAGYNYEVPEMRDFMIDALKYWVEEFNIDGYRCDVAGMVPVDFWNRARYELDQIKPVFMLAEADEPELHDHAFDMTYAWADHFIWNEIAQGEKTVDDLVKQFEKVKAEYEPSEYRMNFISNHDENSWKGHVFERMGDAAEAFVVLSATVPGMPLVYSGQEACLDKKLEFFEKDTINWEKDCHMDELYTQLLHLKKKNQALWNGNFGSPMERIATTADDKIFAFSRIKEENKVVTILNLSEEEVEFKLVNEMDGSDLTELFTGEEFTNIYKLNPWGYKVYKTN